MHTKPCVLPDCILNLLMHDMMMFADEALVGRLSHERMALSNGISASSERPKKHALMLLSVRTQCEDSCLWARKQLVMMVHEPESWLFTWNISGLSPMVSWTLNLWEMNSYNVSYLAYGILFWHPDETKPIFSNVLGKYIASLYLVSAETLVSVLGHLYFGREFRVFLIYSLCLPLALGRKWNRVRIHS